MARWAPSGDNAQPWTFKVHGNDAVTVAVHVSTDNVYEYRNGEPTLISAGTLLENMSIAAASLSKALRWEYQGFDSGEHRIAVHLTEAAVSEPPALLSQIYLRSVDRRPYQIRGLEGDQKIRLSDAAGPEFPVEWFESFSQRRAIAKLTSLATDIRLRIPETFEIHRSIVDWQRRLSPTGIPAEALGLDAMTLKIMRWAMADRSRNDFMNRWFASPSMAAVQMDVLPGICSAAYFTFRIQERPVDPKAAVSQLLRLGQAVQRFWLTAAQLGLAMQPCVAPLAFAHYGRAGVQFTTSGKDRGTAAKLARAMQDVFPDASNLAFMGRIGWPKGRRVETRSTRKPLAELMVPEGQ